MSYYREDGEEYDILVRYGITDFEGTLAPTEGDNVDDRAEQ